MSASPTTPSSSTHARTGSRSSATGASELSSNGTAAPSSPASATKTGAFSRAASIAKRNSLQANGRTPTRTASQSKDSPGTSSNAPKPRRNNSVSMARLGSSSSSSANEATFEDAASDPENVSRMTREQLVAVITRERVEHEEVRTMLHASMLLSSCSCIHCHRQLEARLASLTADHSGLSSAHTELQVQQKLKETKLNEAHATASRFENELAEQGQETEGLRSQLKGAEKESRDAQKRYLDQVGLSCTDRTEHV